MAAEKAADLEVKLGFADHKKTAVALDRALEDLADLSGKYALVFAYCSVKHDLEQVMSAVRSRLGDAPLIGCTTTGEMCRSGVLENGVVVGGIVSDALDAAVGYGTDVFADPAGAARTAVQMARKKLADEAVQGAANRVCLLHTAGFTLDKPGVEEDVLAGIKGELGEGWIIAGGSAGDGARFMKTYQFADGRVLQDSVAVCLLATDLNVIHTMDHGFVPTERSFPITEVEGHIVKRIDGKLALDFWADLLGVKPKKITTGLGLIRLTDKMPKFLLGIGQNVGLTPQLINKKIPFYRFAIENPFGVRSESGTMMVKVPKLITSEGYFEFQTRMEGFKELFLMKLDREKTITASARAISEMASGPNPKLVFVFECAGRYMYLLDDIATLFSNIRGATDAEIAGFFSYAEQGIMEGMGCQTHNYTTSVLGLGPSA